MNVRLIIGTLISLKAALWFLDMLQTSPETREGSCIAIRGHKEA